jgi:mannose-6-phosphate isomerase-like protein (cupin superfamily)
MSQAIVLLDLAADEGSGALRSLESADLDVNLVRFVDGRGVERHVNREVDVLLVVLSGSGVLETTEEQVALTAGQAALIPKGIERGIRSAEDGALVYLTVHRRRARLMPRPARR